MTGPGCPACAFSGRIPFDPAFPMIERPCGACSPYFRPAGFPDAALRAKADAILVDPESASPAMREWAQRLADDVMENG